MALNINNTQNYINDLVNAGADAVKNLYFIDFSSGLLDNSMRTSLLVRSSNLNLPTFTHPTNTVNFMTTSVDFPTSDIEGEKKISITFRLDANYNVYKYLLKQQRLTSVADLGYASTVVSDEKEANDTNNGFTVSVYSMKGAVYNQDMERGDNLLNSEYYDLLYKFKYCWISKIGRPQYKYEGNASNITIQADINFYDFEDPQNLLLG